MMAFSVKEEGDEVFPRKVRGRGDCEYERLDDMGDDDVVYVPIGAAHVRNELGWRAKYDAEKGKLFFIRLNDSSEQRWELPAVYDVVPRCSGISENIGEQRRYQCVGEGAKGMEMFSIHFEEKQEKKEVKVDGGDKNTDIRSGAMCSGDERRDCAYLNNPGLSSAVELVIPRADNNVHNKLVAMRLPLSSPPPSDDEIATKHHPQQGANKNLGLEEGCSELVDSQLLFNSTNRGKNVAIPTASVSQFISPKDMSVQLNTEALVFVLEEEYTARCSCEEEEVISRDALLDAVQSNFDELLLRELSMEREVKCAKPLANIHNNDSVLDAVSKQSEVFLRNKRINNITDDEAETPLERLLYDSLSTVQQPSSCAPSVTGMYSNIYRPPSDNRNDAALPILSGTPQTELRAKDDSQTVSSLPKKSLLPLERLLEAQRHQVEMERRLTQRDRDNLERALDTHYQRIEIPPDSHAQLRYEPSHAFTRERQAFLTAVGSLDNSLPRGGVALPQKEQQQHEGRVPSVGVSPISPRTFVRSPSPSKLPQHTLGAMEKIFAEAYEIKYAVSLEAMQQLMELYQNFMESKPRRRLLHGTSHTQVDKAALSVTLEPSSVKYLERMARIKQLYSSPCTQTSEANDRCYPLYTPPLPPSLDHPNVTSRVEHNPNEAASERHRELFHDPVLEATDMSNERARADVESLSHHLSRSLKGAYVTNATEGKALSHAMEKNSERHETIFQHNTDSGQLPHRRILTPPLIFPEKSRVPGGGVSIFGPVLCWDPNRSGNTLISQKGTTCMADASRALQLIAAETERTGKVLSNVTIPMYALGTIGVAEGEFIFEVRIETHPSLAHTQKGVFAVGVTTKYYRGAHQKSPAYLFRSDGTIVSNSDEEKGVSYGCSYHSGSHVTVHLNLTRQELSFFLNGRLLGVAFRFRGVEDPEPLFPVVVFSGEGDTASFVPPSVPHLPSHMTPVSQQKMRMINMT